MSTAWSWYVIILVTINVVGCAWVLTANAKRGPGEPGPDETTHVWDENIREYNKPMPLWWMNMFYISLIFTVGYLAYYGIAGYAGFGNWSSKGELAAAQEVQRAKIAETFKPYEGLAIDVLAQDPKAVALGRSLFLNNCAACHGTSGQGAVGYPNLTRPETFKWGNTPELVLETVQHGRDGIMAAWGEVLPELYTPTATEDVVKYVRSLSPIGSADPQDPAAIARGKIVFSGNIVVAEDGTETGQYGTCMTCHGDDAKGITALGAPDLTDNYWLYAPTFASMTNTVNNGRHGIMPAWAPALGETRARVAAAYVWSIGHNQAAPASVATAQ